MRLKSRTTAGLLLVAAALCAVPAAGAPAKPSVPKPPAVTIAARIAGPDGGWDYVSADPARHRIYVARTDGVMAIDTTTGQVIDHLTAGARTHGVVVIPGSDLLLVTNGADSTAHLVNAADGALVATIPTGKGPDAAAYEPQTRLVWVMDHAAGDITLIDPVKREAVGTIPVGGILEFAVSDGKGRLYVNAEDKNDIAVIDTKTRKLIGRYSLKGCEGPTGLVLTAKGLLIASCDDAAVVLRASDGKPVTTLKIGGGPDAAIYDAARQRVYIPSGEDGRLWIIDVKGATPRLLGSVATQVGARTGMVDPATGDVYLPAAQYNPPTEAGKRPTMVPGSFVVLKMKAD
ncbi:MAG: gluconolactonase [Caulobacter sp.]|nr:gluconolactonase [Caulobacter sp.]